MRLTEEQIKHITTHAMHVYGNSSRVYLFGSRVDDTAKGGDIDICIESEKNADLSDKLELIARLQQSLGDQKIDVLVKTPKSTPGAIFKIAKEQGVKLN